MCKNENEQQIKCNEEKNKKCRLPKIILAVLLLIVVAMAVVLVVWGFRFFNDSFIKKLTDNGCSGKVLSVVYGAFASVCVICCTILLCLFISKITLCIKYYFEKQAEADKQTELINSLKTTNNNENNVVVSSDKQSYDIAVNATIKLSKDENDKQ